MGAFDLQDIPQLVYLGAIFVAVLGYAIAAHRRNLGRLLRHSALWFFIIIGTVAGIGLWNDFRSASSGLAQMRDTGRDIILSRAMDGHYYLTLQVNDVPVLFMIDTGASQIVLSRQMRHAQASILRASFSQGAPIRPTGAFPPRLCA